MLPRVTRLVALTLALAACSFTTPTPIAYVRRGPAYGQLVTPLAAMPVVCARTTMGCMPGYRLAVASATRMAIELGGYSLVDSELINAELQRRSTRTRETPAGVTTTTELTGRTWLDLAPQQQRDLLTAMGIKGLLYATITMGIPQGMASQRTVTVSIALTRLSDEQLVWQSECGVETGDYHSEPQAIELATRCALESGTLW
jgi:hypothetical protein